MGHCIVDTGSAISGLMQVNVIDFRLYIQLSRTGMKKCKDLVLAFLGVLISHQ